MIIDKNIHLMSVWQKLFGENIVLILTFLSHSQFSPYILIAVNLVFVIFSL